MKRLIVLTLVAGALMVPSARTALAANPHTSSPTGQPNQSCQDTAPPAFPGHTVSSPGSAFNGSAGNVYANPTSQGGISSSNVHVASQYDVACFQQTQR